MLFRKADRLFRAINNGNHEKALCLIKKIRNIDCRDKSGNTPLIAACVNGNMNIVRELLEYGADVNAVNNENESSLLAAAKNGQLEVIDYLIDHNADINIKDRVGYGILHAASGFGHLAVLEILLPVCQEKDVQDIFGNTPLLYAAMYGHSNIIEFLLENGANPDIQNVNGNTPLFEAAAGGHTLAAKALLSRNARTDIANNKNTLPHVIAYNNENYELASYLFQENEKRISGSSTQEPSQSGLIKTSAWFDANIGKSAGYSVSRQTIVGEYDSRDEGKRDYTGLLRKKGDEYYLYSENRDSEILIEGYPRQCAENLSRLTWQDYSTYGVLLEKTISFDK